MPQRRYYCDYCDRSFIDSKQKRDQHFQSPQHKNNVRLWFQSRKGMYFPTVLIFIETAPIVQHCSSIPICESYQHNGFCPLGNMCPYRHVVVTNDMIDGGTVIPGKYSAFYVDHIVGLMETTVRTIEDTPWIPVKRQERDSSRFEEKEEDATIPRAYREKLVPLKVDLPPSLLPVHSSVFESAPPCEWG